MPSVELLASLLARRLRRTENTSFPASVKCPEAGHTRGGKQFSAAGRPYSSGPGSRDQWPGPPQQIGIACHARQIHRSSEGSN